MTELTTQTFAGFVSNPAFTVVDFWATWCGPCRAYSPIFSEVAKDYPELSFAKFDCTKDTDKASELGFISLPTTAVFKDGKLVTSRGGSMSEKTLRQWLDNNTTNNK